MIIWKTAAFTGEDRLFIGDDEYTAKEKLIRFRKERNYAEAHRILDTNEIPELQGKKIEAKGIVGNSIKIKVDGKMYDIESFFNTYYYGKNEPATAEAIGKKIYMGV